MIPQSRLEAILRKHLGFGAFDMDDCWKEDVPRLAAHIVSENFKASSDDPLSTKVLAALGIIEHYLKTHDTRLTVYEKPSGDMELHMASINLPIIAMSDRKTFQLVDVLLQFATRIIEEKA